MVDPGIQPPLTSALAAQEGAGDDPGGLRRLLSASAQRGLNLKFYDQSRYSVIGQTIADP
jgi:hypothetical protein